MLKKLRRILAVMAIVGAVVLLGGFWFENMALRAIGAAVILLMLPVRLSMWKCPYCKAPLPWTIAINANYPYRCQNCGKDVEL